MPFNSIRRVLGLKTGEPAKPNGVVPRSSPKSPFYKTADLSSWLTRSDSPTLVAGSFQIIDFSDVRVRLGAAWDEVSGHCDRILNEELQRQLNADDTSQRVEGLTYVVCFAQASREEAAALAELIAAQVRRRLKSELPAIADLLGFRQVVAAVERARVLGSGKPIAESLLAELESARQEVVVAARAEAAFAVDEMNVLFQPSWSPRKLRTDLNRCVPDSSLAIAAAQQSESYRDQTQLNAILADFDIVVLTRAMMGLHANARRQRALVPVAVPVHYATLRDREGRARFCALVDALPQIYRRQLFVEIISPQRGGMLDFNDMLREMRRMGCQVILKLNSAIDTHVLAAGENLWGVSYEFDQSDKMGVTNLVRRATAFGLKSIALGADSAGAVESARMTGFDLICGTAIHGLIDAPRPAERYTPVVAQMHRPSQMGEVLGGTASTTGGTDPAVPKVKFGQP